jgi:hypothetical protein
MWVETLCTESQYYRPRWHATPSRSVVFEGHRLESESLSQGVDNADIQSGDPLRQALAPASLLHAAGLGQGGFRDLMTHKLDFDYSDAYERSDGFVSLARHGNAENERPSRPGKALKSEHTS